MNRGYSGYYRETYLRSSYEYAYAKYLDYLGITWTYEERTFNLGYKTYKPDFFIYDKQNSLLKIVEIKHRDPIVLARTKVDLELTTSLYRISAEIISYEELLNLYKELPMSLTSTLNQWIESEKTTINKNWEGSLNPHYNQKHNENTKKYISDRTKERWQDPILRTKMLAGFLKGAEAVKAKKGTWIKVPRVSRDCEHCKKQFWKLATSVQRFCSDICGGKFGFKLANEVYKKKQAASSLENKKLCT
ncbi:restriction endonuclease [Paenibacillus sp. LMG 31461]|uniref:Restriction endonuclease n=1 Tax=Paenibacillus plantarum TaxID=2654975 RepID=A0ABX1XG38_9BACL|nr:restriction endonuclease [Paenibacillus plantarum]NOU67485.1 restriction endonuclease [Paenibacillus plantarum]